MNTSLDGLQWTCAALGALLVGISKTAISGLAALAVALFAYSFASGKQASGLVLPLLIFGDLVAVLSYHSHTQWRYLWKLPLDSARRHFRNPGVVEMHREPRLITLPSLMAKDNRWRASRSVISMNP